MQSLQREPAKRGGAMQLIYKTIAASLGLLALACIEGIC